MGWSVAYKFRSERDKWSLMIEANFFVTLARCKVESWPQILFGSTKILGFKLDGEDVKALSWCLLPLGLTWGCWQQLVDWVLYYVPQDFKRKMLFVIKVFKRNLSITLDFLKLTNIYIYKQKYWRMRKVDKMT